MTPLTDGPAMAERWIAPDEYTLRDRAVVVAMDDSADARAAAHAAAALAQAKGAQPAVLRAYYPSPELFPSTPATPEAVTRELDDRRRDTRDALVETIPHAAHWPVFVVPGAPSSALATTARELRAALILLGLRKRAALPSALRPETTLSVLREATTPVFATTASMRGLARRIVVGVDFARAALCAARAALAIIADGGTLVLAYVQAPGAAATEETEGEAIIHAQGVVGGFVRFREELHAPATVRVETAIVEGTPGAALAALADRVNAAVIAVGSRRHSLTDRMFIGSATQDLVRDAGHSLLIVPPRHG